MSLSNVMPLISSDLDGGSLSGRQGLMLRVEELPWDGDMGLCYKYESSKLVMNHHLTIVLNGIRIKWGNYNS